MTPTLRQRLHEVCPCFRGENDPDCDAVKSAQWCKCSLADGVPEFRQCLWPGHALIDSIPDAPEPLPDSAEIEEAIYLARRGHQPNCPCDNCATVGRLGSLLRQGWADRKAALDSHHCPCCSKWNSSTVETMKLEHRALSGKVRGADMSAHDGIADESLKAAEEFLEDLSGEVDK